jgi:hypothetical protein
MPYPVRFEGRCRTSPKGGNRENVLMRSAGAMSYGDLNGRNVVRGADHGVVYAAESVAS